MKQLLAVVAMALWILSGCTSTASNNTTSAQPQGLGPDAAVGGDRSDGMDPGPDLVD
jgi:outer membrane murein-binding lipoprotein Lpp